MELMLQQTMPHAYILYSNIVATLAVKVWAPRVATPTILVSNGVRGYSLVDNAWLGVSLLTDAGVGNIWHPEERKERG
ncbi:hypothetical protein ACLKA7_016447 [Drosophila subpalustris]